MILLLLKMVRKACQASDDLHSDHFHPIKNLYG